MKHLAAPFVIVGLVFWATLQALAFLFLLLFPPTRARAINVLDHRQG